MGVDWMAEGHSEFDGYLSSTKRGYQKLIGLLSPAFSKIVWIDQIFDSNQILVRFDQTTRRRDLTHLDYGDLSSICKYLTDLTDLIEYKKGVQ